jgi:hypothetical protein
MRQSNLRHRIAVAGAVGVTTLIVTLGLGAGVASAVPSDPPGGSTPVYPSFNNGVVNGIRNTGSDTTFYMMQKIADLYTSAGLYGCTLNSAGGQALYNSGIVNTVGSPAPAEGYCRASDNVSTTDTADNWNRTEITEGVDDVGSGAGQAQLCGSSDLASPLAVDFARSSKPVGSLPAGCSEVGTGYAKDSVPAVAFQINPSTFGTPSVGSPYASVNGGQIGDLDLGWLPGDPTAGPYTGTAFTNVANNDNGGGASSTAYRLWCVTDTTRITDWGQLTNLGPNLVAPNVRLTSGQSTATLSFALPSNLTGTYAVTDVSTPGNLPGGETASASGGTTLTLTAPASGSGTDQLQLAIVTKQAVGSGAQIGVPVRIMGVNTASGTESTWQSYSESGVSGSATGNGCSSSADTNAASDPNPSTATGDNAGQHIALENNASQISDYAQADWPSDPGDSAVEVASTLYYESNGVYTSNPYSASATIGTTQFSASKLSENSKSTTTGNVLNNVYPTARTLFNIYNPATVRGSTGGFLNWLCDSQSQITKQKDNSTGVNFDTEITNLIGSFGFIRLTDASNVASGGNTPPDNVGGGGVNTSCASGLNGGSTAGNGQPAVTSVASPGT